MTPRLMFSLFAGVAALIVLLNSVFIVRETNQAIVVSLGKIDRVIAEVGIHFRVPFFQQVLVIDRRILASSAEPEEVLTKDKKRIVVDSFTRWRVLDAKKFYEAVRSESNARARLNSIVDSLLRSQIANVTLEDLSTAKRDEVMTAILAQANKEAAPLGMSVVDVRIKRTDLPEANAQAVFNRMRTEREKEAKEIRAKGDEEAQKIRANADKERTILLAEARKQSETLRGQGDAEATKVFARAHSQDPAFYGFMRSMEAYRASLANPEKLILVDPSVEFLRPLRGSTN